MNNQEEILNELKAIAPILTEIDKTPVQSVPPDYFEQFEVLLPVKQTAVVKMPALRKWFIYASAAVVTGILITAGFVYTNRNKDSFEYDRYNSVNIDEALNNLTDEELQQYIYNAVALSGAGNMFSPDDETYISDDNLETEFYENSYELKKAN